MIILSEDKVLFEMLSPEDVKGVLISLLNDEILEENAGKTHGVVEGEAGECVNNTAINGIVCDGYSGGVDDLTSAGRIVYVALSRKNKRIRNAKSENGKKGGAPKGNKNACKNVNKKEG